MNRRLRIRAGLVAALTAVVCVASIEAQNLFVRTVEDRDHVTIMEVGGIYDRQPESNRAYEIAIRRAVAKEFLRTHADDYDFVVTFAGFPYALGDDTEGQQVGGRYYALKNDILGIGQEIFDASAEFGSSGRLQGYIDMGVLSRLVTDPTDPNFENTLSNLAHELLHRWAAHVRFKDADGSLSTALLGRGGVHWSFLLQSHNSVLYGNDWRDNGDGTFTSQGRSRTFYGPLDLYLMGMLDRSQVPPSVLIQNGAVDPARLPEIGATIQGTPRTITIDDIIAAEGERVPSTQNAPRQFKMAFIYLARPGEQAHARDLRGINAIRDAFATRFAILTGGQGTVQVFPEQPADPPAPPSPARPPSSGPRTAPLDLVQGVDWLLSRQLTDGAWGDAAATRVRDSVAALDLLKQTPSTYLAHQKGLAWLTAHADLRNVDAVSRRLVALAPQFSPADSAFLTETRNPDGGWGLARGYHSDPLDTALAVRALPQGDPAPALAYLLSTQNTDGGWGVRPDSPSSVTTTLAAIDLGVRHQTSDLGAALERASAWLRTRQNTDGGFGSSPSTVPETALAILALVNTSVPKADLTRALDYLERSQLADGSWNEGVYDTALAIRALKTGGLPNLSAIATALEFSPAAPTDGDVVTISSRIANESLQDARDVVVRFYTGDPVAGGIPIGSEVLVASLPGLAEAPVTVTWDTTNRSGPHQIYVVVDPGGQIEEFNEADNLALKALTIRPAPADAELRIGPADLTLTPATLQSIPQSQALAARISNVGRTGADVVTAALYDGDPATGSRVGEATVQVPARGSAVATFAFQVTAVQDHRYFVVVDSASRFVEADETDNQASVVLPVQSAFDFRLAPDAVSFSANPAALGTNLTISAEVRNQGTTDAFAVPVRFFLDDPAGPFELGTSTIDVPAGQTRAASIIWRTSRPVADLAVVALADPANQFPETSETNNRASTGLSVPAASGPNLRVTHQELGITTPVLQGGTATISIPVRNTGAADAPAVSIAFFVGVPGNGGVQIGATQIIPQIPAGGQAAASVAWTEIAASGNKLITVVVDPANGVEEFDEEDNTAFVTTHVLSLPDLAISRGAISFSPPFPKQGDSVAVQAVVSNTGEQEAAGVRVRVFAGHPAAGGTQMGDDLVIAQVPGNGQRTVLVPLNDQMQPGVTEIFVQVDPANTTTESDETNNLASRTLGVQDGSLSVSNVYISPDGNGVQDGTELFFRLSGPSASSVEVTDRERKTVRTLTLDAALESGSVTWDGRNNAGVVVPDGAYTLVLLSADSQELGSATVVVDNNASPVTDALGTKFLVENKLTANAGYPLPGSQGTMAFRSAGWVPDDSALVSWFPRQWYCDYNLPTNPPTYRCTYRFHTDTQTGVYLNSLDGSSVRITPDSWTSETDPRRIEQVTLSPDGSRLLIGLSRYARDWRPAQRCSIFGCVFLGFYFDSMPRVGPLELWTINLDGSGLRLVTTVTEDITGPIWSPDGTKLALRTPTLGLQIVQADGSGAVSVTGTALDGYFTLFSSTWSLDSSRLQYASYTPSTGMPLVVVVDADGTHKRSLVIYHEYSAHWLAGGRLALPGTIGTSRAFRVFDTSGSELTPVLEIPNLATVVPSPDGRTFAYTDFTESDLVEQRSTGVWIAGDTGQVEQIYSTSAPNRGITGIAWSAAGTVLSFVEEVTVEHAVCQGEGPYFCGTTQLSVGRLDLDGDRGSPKLFPVAGPQEANSSRLRSIGPFPDGRSYLFSEDDRRMTAVSLIDGARAVVVDDPQAYSGTFRVSPSGRHVLYESYRESTAGDTFVLSSLLNLTAMFGLQRDRSQLLFKGTVEDLNFAEYRLEYAPVSDTLQWSPIGTASDIGVINDLLGGWIPASDGSFHVRLTALDKAGNEATSTKRVTWGLTPTITNVSVAPRQFSPDGNGVKDSVTVDYRVLGPVHLVFDFFDAQNTLVRTISQNHVSIGAASIAWDGRTDAGAIVPDGLYRIAVLDYSFFITVDTRPPDAAISLGSAVHTLEQKLQCVTVNGQQACAVVPGPVLDAPYVDLRGRAVDSHLASWRLEVGLGPNPTEWLFVSEGVEAVLAKDTSGDPVQPAADTLLRRLDRLQDVVGRQYRLTAVDRAGNTRVVVSGFAPEEIVLHGWDGGAVPTERALEQKLGAHVVSIGQTIRSAFVSFVLQYRVAGSSVWVNGPAVSSPSAELEVPWDTSPLAGGRTYEVRIGAEDVNGRDFSSNIVRIHSDVFELTRFEKDSGTTFGTASLSEPLASIALVMVGGGDPEIGIGGPTYLDEVSFTIRVAPDSTLSSCYSRQVTARYRGIGSSGAVYYSNAVTVDRRGGKPATCTSIRHGARLELVVDTMMAAACGAPSPGRVTIRLTGSGVDPASVKLLIQDVPNGLLKETPNVTLPFSMELETPGKPEGTYLVQATALSTVAGEAGRYVADTGTFVVDRAPPAAQITYPGANQALCGVKSGTQSLLTLEGVADDPNFDHYTLAFGPGASPLSWTPLFPLNEADQAASRVARHGILAAWDVGNLSRGTYSVRLQVFDKGGNVSCATVSFFFEGSVRLQNASAGPRLFSPYVDGTFDSTAFSFSLDVDALVDLKIYQLLNGQPSQDPVRTLLSHALLLAGTNQVLWDGYDDLGAPVPDGKYRVVADALDGCGGTVRATMEVEVDNTKPEATITSPQSSDVPGVLLEIRGSVSDAHFERFLVEVGAGDAPISWTRLAQGAAQVQDRVLAKWNNNGAAGVYTVRLTARDTVGNERVTLLPITVPDRPLLVTSVMSEPTVFSPNADGNADATKVEYVTGDTVNIAIEVTDINGAVVARLSDAASQAPGTYTAWWNGAGAAGVALPDGDYTLRITATASDDPNRTQVEKATVRRDTAVPALTFVMPVDSSFVGSRFNVIGTITDANIDRYSVAYQPAGGAAIALEEGHQNRVLHSFGSLELAAGTYALTFAATDLAQNRAERTISFTVDDTAPQAAIALPEPGTVVGGTTPGVQVRGSVTEPNLDRWTLRLGSGTDPASWTTIASETTPPPAGLLAVWDVASAPEGAVTLSLVATDKAGASSEARVPVVVDTTAPTAAITQPIDGTRIAAATQIVGTAADANLKSAILEVSPGPAATAFEFTTLATLTQSVTSANLFSWQALPPDGTYTLRLTVADQAGLTAQAVATVIVDTQPPAPPSGLTATLESRMHVRLNWTIDGGADAAGFNIYRDGAKITGAPLAAAATGYLDQTLTDGTHRYVVKAIGLSGLESQPSNDALIAVDLTPPATKITSPSNGATVSGLLEIAGTAASSDLAEYRVSIATGSAPLQFTLLRQSPAPVTLGRLADLNTSGLADGSLVTIRLETVDVAGNTGSDQVTVRLDNLAPQPPVLVSADRSGTSVTVRWQTGADSDLAGVLLYRSDVLVNARGIVTGSLTPYALTGTTFVDQSLADGQWRYYAVAIDRAANLSGPSNVATVTVETRAPRATVVSPYSGVYVDRQLTLFGASPDEDVAQFQFQFSEAGGSVWTNIGAPDTINPPHRTWDLSSLPYGQFDVRVVATDTNGNVDPAPAVITINHRDLTPPAAPTDVQARVNGGSVTVTWTASVASDLAGYLVLRRTAKGGLEQVATGDTISGTSLTFDSPSDGLFTFVVLALDTLSNYSEPSNAAPAHVYTPVLTVPAMCTADAITVVTGFGAEPGGTVRLFMGTGQAAPQTASVQAGADGRFQFGAIGLAAGANVLSADAADPSGNVSRRSLPVTVSSGPLVPAAPTGLTATVSGFEVALGWNAATDPTVRGYSLRRGSTDLNPIVDATPSGAASASSQDDPASFAVDGASNSSWDPLYDEDPAPWWQLAFADVIDVRQIRVIWSAGQPAPRFDVQRWDGSTWATIRSFANITEDQQTIDLPGGVLTSRIRIWIVNSNGGQAALAEVTVSKRDLVGGIAFADAVVPDGRHVYTLAAVNACFVAGPPISAGAAVGDVTPPAAPRDLSAVVTGADVTLLWLANTEGDLAAYHVYRNSGGAWTRLSQEPVASATFVDRVVPNGSHLYRVSAVDAAANESSPSNEAQAVVDVARQPPSAPVIMAPTDAAHPKTLQAGETSIAGRSDPGTSVTLVKAGVPLSTTQASEHGTTESFTLPTSAQSTFGFSAASNLLASFAASPDGGAVQLALTDVKTKTTVFVPQATNGFAPVFSPDGAKVGYATQWTPVFNVFDRVAGRMSSFNLPSWATSYAFAPDGNRVALAIEQRDIWILDLVTRTVTQLTSTGSQAESPIWSGDGRTLAYRRNYSVEVVDVASGATTTVDAGAFSDPFETSPDGRTLAFASWRVGELDVWLYDFVATTLRRADPTPSDYRRSAPAFSPDGHSLSYVEEGPNGDRLRVLDLASGQAADVAPQLESQARPFFWTSDLSLIQAHAYREDVTVFRLPGRFEFPDVQLEAGLNVFSAIAADAAGTQSAPSAPIAITVDAGALADLSIVADGLTAYPQYPRPGETVRLSAIVHNVGTRVATSVPVAFFDNGAASGTPSPIGPVQAIPILGPGGQTVVFVDWMAPAVAGRHELSAVVDPANRIVELLESNNSASRDAFVTPDGLPAVQLTIDRPSYGAADPVRLAIGVANPATAADFALDLVIEDTAGARTALVSHDALPALAHTNRSFSKSWPASSVLAGDYRARAILTRGDGRRFDATASFTILPSQSLTARVSTDKASYNAGDRVAITGRVQNTSANVELAGLTTQILVFNAQGTEAFRSDASLARLFLDGVAQVSTEWPGAAPGTYSTRFTVRSGAGDLATQSAQFTIRGVGKLTGQLSVTPGVVALGRPATIAADVANAGSLDLQGVVVRVVVQDPATQQSLQTFERAAVDLPISAGVSWEVSLPTADLRLQSYTVLLQTLAIPPATLASATLTVIDAEAPAVRIVSPAPGAFLNRALDLAALAADNASGIDRVEFRIDQGSWQALPPVDPVTGRYAQTYPATTATEGTRTLTVRARDRAGNGEGTSLSDANPASVSFTIDVTPPQVVVSGVADGALGNQPVTPIVHITDPNLADSTILLNGAPYAGGTPVSAEQDHVLDVVAHDRAANETHRIVRFAIDLTRPSVSVTGVTDGATYRAAVTPTVSIADASAVTQAVLLNGSPFVSGTAIAQEGSYTLAASATDAAGNASSQTVRFEVRLNEPPVAIGQSVTTNEDTAIAITIAATDPNGDTISFAVTPPSSGALTGTPPTLTYTPSRDFNGTDTLTFTASDGSLSSAPATVSITVTPVNDPPVAVVGADQGVTTGDQVTLDGSGSADPDGDSLTYEWRQIAGTPVAIDTSNPARPVFLAPGVMPDGDVLTFQLVVRDGSAGSAPATVNVAVKSRNHQPVADAGPAQTVKEGRSVCLDGTASYDPDGDRLFYTWVQRQGLPVDLAAADTAQPSFTAPFVAGSRQTLRFELTVSDGLTASADVVEIVVEGVNHRPIARAGRDQSKNEHALVTLDGSGSSDADGDSLTYRWRQADGPPVELSDRSSPTPSFTAPEVGSGGGSLVFELVVNDGSRNSAKDTVTITILNVEQAPACTLAVPSLRILWPPDHRLVPVAITGLTDSDDDCHGDHDRGDDDHRRPRRGGDRDHVRIDDPDRHTSRAGQHDTHPRVRIDISRVTQDEPVDGRGDGHTSPDAVIQGETVLLRAERAANGNGRVYQIFFTVTAGSGASCTGSVTVGVPVSMKPGIHVVDDGQHYDSTRKK